MDTTSRMVLPSEYCVASADPDQLDLLRRHGIDHHGLPVEPFVDPDGDWPLRCCLTDSRPGDRLAIVGWSPFPWNGAYRMTGPVVIHADHCPRLLEGAAPEGAAPEGAASDGAALDGAALDGAALDGRLPAVFGERRQILWAYDGDHLQVYDLARLVEPGEGLGQALAEILVDPRTDLVQSFNVLSGCWSFTARRRECRDPDPGAFRTTQPPVEPA